MRISDWSSDVCSSDLTCVCSGSRKGNKKSDTAKAKISRAHKSVWNTSQRRAKHDEILRKRWDSTDQRVKQGLRSKKRWGDPEFREKTVAAQKAVWDDPEYRAKRMKGMRGAQSPRAIKVKSTIRNKDGVTLTAVPFRRSEEHTSELKSLMSTT